MLLIWNSLMSTLSVAVEFSMPEGVQMVLEKVYIMMMMINQQAY